jgi:hypothetical protein
MNINKKVCITYTGGWNLSDLSVYSHKLLYDYLNKNNIKYDVFISVANEIVLKSYDKEEVENGIDKLNNIHNLKFNKESIHNHLFNKKLFWFSVFLDTNYIKNLFEKIVGKSNIKHIDFKIKENGSKKYNDGTEVQGHSVHFLPDFFHSNYYKRFTRLSNEINTNNYFKFINIRPDFKISRINLLTNILKHKVTTNYLYCDYRLDYINISNKLLPDFFNKKSYLKLLEKQIDKKNEEFLKYVKDNTIHLEIHFKKIFKLFNIEELNQNIYVGERIECKNI